MILHGCSRQGEVSGNTYHDESQDGLGEYFDGKERHHEAVDADRGGDDGVFQKVPILEDQVQKHVNLDQDDGVLQVRQDAVVVHVVVQSHYGEAETNGFHVGVFGDVKKTHVRMLLLFIKSAKSYLFKRIYQIHKPLRFCSAWVVSIDIHYDKTQLVSVVVCCQGGSSRRRRVSNSTPARIIYHTINQFTNNRPLT